jgi:hypothetical protein
MNQHLIPLPSSEVEPSRSSRRLERSVGDALQRMGGHHVLDVARVRAAEDLQIERIHAVESIASEGVMSASMLMSKARLLMDMNPIDAGVIQSIAQIGAVGIAEIVSRSGRKLS